MNDQKTMEAASAKENTGNSEFRHDPNVGYYRGGIWEIKATVRYSASGDYFVDVEVIQPATGSLEDTPFKKDPHIFPNPMDEVIRVREIVYFLDTAASDNTRVRTHKVTAAEVLRDMEEVISIRVVTDKNDLKNMDANLKDKGKDIPKRPKVVLIKQS